MRQAAPQHMTGSVNDSVVDDDTRTWNREVIEGSWEGLKKPGLRRDRGKKTSR